MKELLVCYKIVEMSFGPSVHMPVKPFLARRKVALASKCADLEAWAIVFVHR